jgi:acetyltransferase
MQPDDAQNLVDIFEHMSPESRYLRFHEALTHASSQLVRETAAEFATMPPEKGKGWLAFADLPDQPCAPIGGVRYVRLANDPGAAEVALTVRDDLHGQGIGRELLKVLTAQARAEGLRKLIAIIQADNRAVLKLLSAAPIPIERTFENGEIYMEADLTAATEEARA